MTEPAGARNFLRCRGGGPAVEFAFVLPVLLLVLLGIFQFGTALFLHANMANAAREAARQLAVGEVAVAAGGPPYAAGTAEQVALAHLADWGQTFTVTARAPAPADLDRAVSVRVAVPLAQASPLVDVLGLFGGKLLVAEVTMRKEQ